MDEKVAAAEARVGRARAGKRDLLELGAAAALSLAFFTVPAVLSYRAVRPSPRPPASRSATAGPGNPDASLPTDRTRPADGAVVRVVQTDVTPAVSTPAIVSAPARGAVREASARPARGKWAARDARVPFVRRLVRLLAGNGRHAIQPFPAVPSTNR